MRFLLVLHILGGSAALVAGPLALYASKGATLHRYAGAVFVTAMLLMALTGATIASFHGREASVVAGLLATYLVLTALLTMRSRSLRLESVLMLLAAAIAVASLAWGVDTVVNRGGSREGIPAAIFFVFGAVALISALGDLRLRRRGDIRGAERLARHLWRMCFALWIATSSFFLGQANQIPEALRIMPVLVTLAFLPLAVMLYWLWRVRRRRPVRGMVVRSDVSVRAPSTTRPVIRTR